MELCTVQYQIIQVINGECTSSNSVRLVDSEAVLQESGFSWCIHCRQAARPKSLARHEELPLLRPTVRIHQNSPLRHRDIETSKHRMCERRPALSSGCMFCMSTKVSRPNQYSIQYTCWHTFVDVCRQKNELTRRRISCTSCMSSRQNGCLPHAAENAITPAPKMSLLAQPTELVM